MVLIGDAAASGLCKDSSNATVVRAGESYGGFADGTSISLEVDAGQSRTVSIIGFATTLSYCPTFSSLTLAERSATGPATLVGQTTANFPAGGDVTLDITISLTGAKQISTCSNFPFNWEQSTNGVWGQSTWDNATWGP